MSLRLWLSYLRSAKGDTPHWQLLLQRFVPDAWEQMSREASDADCLKRKGRHLVAGMLIDAFRTQRCDDATYEGEVFINRDDAPDVEGTREEHLVKRLYLQCLKSPTDPGCLVLEQEKTWLLGWQFPTQGGDKEKSRRADLVGVRQDGGLVVFECKREDNRDSLLIAILEGLDYLACLLQNGNFSKLTRGFEGWKGQRSVSGAIPTGFDEVLPEISAEPWVVLLAPKQYYQMQLRGSRRSGSVNLACAMMADAKCVVGVRLVVTDFSTNEAELLQWR
ncbi:MAG: hypothetical protein KDA44_10335 [Planctomycetales bacterium]|nr:hypothetical protein [Planctomycetales bacterium]